MMVTPIEAIELHQYLKSAQLLNQELKTKCEETVSKYRLDQALGNGRRTLIRRTYTCPFFGHQELGCPLPREVKPYGCLAFNAHDQEKKGGEFCFSDVKLLEEREKLMGTEDLLNQELKEKFKLHWDKLPLPLALLELWDADTEILFAD